MATIGCGISHKNTKDTDKCSNKTTKPQANTFSKYCKDNIKFGIKYTHIVQGTYNEALHPLNAVVLRHKEHHLTPLFVSPGFVCNHDGSYNYNGTIVIIKH
jgi:hypothetical protein